jgi:hypothetical protein
MIKQIIDCLKLDLKSDSERVAIARGKNKLPETFKETYKQVKNIFNGSRHRG